MKPWRPRDYRLTKDELLVRLREILKRCTEDLAFLTEYAATLKEPDIELIKTLEKKVKAVAAQGLYIQQLEKRKH
jgi:hypothetical protein